MKRSIKIAVAAAMALSTTSAIRNQWRSFDRNRC
jgi:hypothetical protein